MARCWSGPWARKIATLERAWTSSGRPDSMVVARRDQRLAGDLGVDREAGRAALVGLEAMAEATVVVLVAAQGVDHPLRRCPLEEGGEHPLFEETGVGEGELPGLGERVLVHGSRHS